MSRAGFYQLVCVVLLVLFIGFSFSGEKEITKTAPEIAAEVVSVMDTENLAEFDKLKFEEQFGFDADSFDSWIYYASEDIMDVRELLIIKLRAGEDSQKTESVIEKRAEEKYNTFKDYDPTAASLLKNRVMRNENGVIFYAVGENSAAAAEEFTDTID